MVDDFEILGVARDATEEEIKRAYFVRIRECSWDAGVERAYDVQLVREAYINVNMKLIHANGNLAIHCTFEEICCGMLCRCGSRYSLEDLLDNIIECQNCSCYLLLK